MTSDIDIQENYSAAELATKIIPDDYFEADPPIPYGLWRDNVKDGRSQISIYIQQSKLEQMEQQAQEILEEEFENEISITDIRSLALLYGLSQIEDICEIADIWGLQHY